MKDSTLTGLYKITDTEKPQLIFPVFSNYWHRVYHTENCIYLFKYRGRAPYPVIEINLRTEQTRKVLLNEFIEDICVKAGKILLIQRNTKSKEYRIQAIH